MILNFLLVRFSQVLSQVLRLKYDADANPVCKEALTVKPAPFVKLSHIVYVVALLPRFALQAMPAPASNACPSQQSDC